VWDCSLGIGRGVNP